MFEIDLPRLYERDIDVLLQEELIFNKAVRSVFSRALDIPDHVAIKRCGLSVVDSTGETDLFAVFSAGNRQGAILIENKIDAGFQPLQPERYRQRAAALAGEQSVDAVYTVLVAPARYLRFAGAAVGAFDATLSYEDIAESVASEGSARAAHRAELILRAVDRARQAYVLVPDEQVTNLWDQVYRIACSEFPDLAMKAPAKKGGNSNWIIFKGDLPFRITVDWKIKKGTIDLSFWKGAVHYPPISLDLHTLGTGATRRLLGETTVIQMPAPRASEE